MIGTIVFMCFFARGFDPEAGFPLVLSLILGHRVLCLYMIRHCFVKSQGGCRCDLPKVTVSCRLTWLGYSTKCVLVVCVTCEAHSLPLSFAVCARQPIIHDLNIYSFDCGTVDANRRGCINILEFGT